MATTISVVSEGATEIVLRNKMRIARLLDMRPELDAATGIVYEHTRQWYDSRGEGQWPPLAESTIARKASQGNAEPSRPLYAEGSLYESVTSDSGPYSFKHFPDDHSVVIGADWDENGWQIPVVLDSGTTTAGVNHDVVIPARPIWPTEGSQADDALRREVGAVLTKALTLT